MLGNKLKSKRIEIGLSQSKLSELTGIVQARISGFELNKADLTEDEKGKLFSCLDSICQNKLATIKKKRYSKVEDGKSVINDNTRRSYQKTEKNQQYLDELDKLEKRFQSGEKKATAISFFAGGGGLCYGTKAAGFDILASNELVDGYRDIYKKNFNGIEYLSPDIRQIEQSELEKFKDVDLIIGGPPCQGFSLAGKRDVNDDRNNLFENYLQLASVVKPKVILMENVRLLTSMKDTDGNYVKDRVLAMFDKTGYNSAFYELNAKDFGVPQHRERVFFIGIRKDLERKPSVPQAKYGDSSDMFSSDYFCFGDAVSDLDYIESGESSNHDKYHKAVKHPEHVLRWLYDVPQGKSAHDNEDESMRPPSGYNTTYKRQVWDEPAGTVATTFSMISGCRNVHPVATRSLTTREALRLQSFPDSYQLTGKQGDIRTVIGNAVPPLLGYHLANHILNTYIL